MNQAFAAKYRRKVFIAQIINKLSTIFAAFRLQFNAKIIDFDGEEVHVHLLILYPPKLSIAALVFKLKGTSSVIIRNRKLPPLSFATEIIHPSNRSFGARLYGLPLILLHPAQVLPYLLSDNILTGRKHLIKH